MVSIFMAAGYCKGWTWGRNSRWSALTGCRVLLTGSAEMGALVWGVATALAGIDVPIGTELEGRIGGDAATADGNVLLRHPPIQPLLALWDLTASGSRGETRSGGLVPHLRHHPFWGFRFLF